MTDSLKQRIAECYRRAEEYKRLYHRSSNLDERDMYFLTTMQLTRLAEELTMQLPGHDRDKLEVQASPQQ
jgi:hypothetical protein